VSVPVAPERIWSASFCRPQFTREASKWPKITFSVSPCLMAPAADARPGGGGVLLALPRPLRAATRHPPQRRARFAPVPACVPCSERPATPVRSARGASCLSCHPPPSARAAPRSSITALPRSRLASLLVLPSSPPGFPVLLLFLSFLYNVWLYLPVLLGVSD